MSTRAAKWGNSVGVRIPARMASEIGLEPGTEVKMATEGKTLRIVPRQRSADRKYRLNDLLRGIRKSTLHGETKTGKAAGAEIVE